MTRNSASRLISACPLALAGTAAAASAESPDAASWAAHAGAACRVTNDVVYHGAANCDLELDVHVPMQAKGPLPAAMYFHGGWVKRSKETMVPNILPCLERGVVVTGIRQRPPSAASRECPLLHPQPA
jgi:acetyl esterase/lipase